MPVTVGRNVYAHDLAILHSANDWQALERILTQESGHSNLILLPLQMETEAQYNKECLGNLPSLKQGGTAGA